MTVDATIRDTIRKYQFTPFDQSDLRIQQSCSERTILNLEYFFSCYAVHLTKCTVSRFIIQFNSIICQANKWNVGVKYVQLPHHLLVALPYYHLTNSLRTSCTTRKHWL